MVSMLLAFWFLISGTVPQIDLTNSWDGNCCPPTSVYSYQVVDGNCCPPTSVYSYQVVDGKVLVNER